jgi:hypothetical protein
MVTASVRSEWPQVWPIYPNLATLLSVVDDNAVSVVAKPKAESREVELVNRPLLSMDRENLPYSLKSLRMIH